MVRAILREIEAPGTGKTQTRRVLPVINGLTLGEVMLDGIREAGSYQASREQVREPRYKLGDRLYVREHWRCSAKQDEKAPRDLTPRSMTIAFEAGGSIANQDSRDDWRPSPASYTEADWMGRFRQGMHMPRWASRLTLTVSDVRVQRLQEISEVDARAEGVDGSCWDDWRDYGGPSTYLPAYRTLWNSLHGPDAWDANPWVAAYSFRPRLGNIDKIGAAV